jgi:hypothetical protein
MIREGGDESRLCGKVTLRQGDRAPFLIPSERIRLKPAGDPWKQWLAPPRSIIMLAMKAARSRIGTRCDRLAALLAVTAVLLRCVVAPGLMLDPTAAARGELKFVICTPTGAKSIAVTADNQSPPQQRGEGDICPYAAPGHAGKLTNPVLLIGERLPPVFEAPERDTAFQFARLRAFAARAPPAIA